MLKIYKEVELSIELSRKDEVIEKLKEFEVDYYARRFNNNEEYQEISCHVEMDKYEGFINWLDKEYDGLARILI